MVDFELGRAGLADRSDEKDLIGKLLVKDPFLVRKDGDKAIVADDEELADLTEVRVQLDPLAHAAHQRALVERLATA